MKLKLALLLILAGTFISALAAGCSVGNRAQDRIDEFAAEAQVTYYAGGGMFDKNTTIKSKNVYFHAGTPIMEIMEDSADAESTIKISYPESGYIFDGWYYCVMEDGKPKFASEEDRENGVALIDENKPVNFERKLEKDEHLYVCANWVMDVRLDVILVYDGEKPIAAEGGKSFSDGDVVRQRSFNASGVITLEIEPFKPATSGEASFINYYSDKECTQRINKVIRPDDDSTPAPVYVKYIPGAWTVVRTDANVRTMFQNLMGNYYISPNEGYEIDCSSLSDFPTKLGVVNCKIEGEGNVTLSGLTFKATPAANRKYSIFGSLGANFSIKNVTFKDLTVNYTLNLRSNDIELYAFCTEVTTGASFENVNIENLSVNVSMLVGSGTMEVANIASRKDAQGNLLGYVTTNWMFGGLDGGDAEFTEEFDVKVTNYKLTMFGEIAAQS